MRITIAARHCEVPAELRERAQELVLRLEKVARRLERAQVIFDADRGSATVELRLHRPPGQVHVAVASAVDHRSALDRAVAKLRRQLDKSPARRPHASTRTLR